MAMMAKMRNLAPAFIIAVGGLFVLFMVISDSNVLEVLGARTNNIGSVNGRDITYQEFSNYMDRAIENQKAQTGQDINEDNMDYFRDQVWDALVTQILTEEQLKKFGIVISDDEIRSVILGENPPDFLKSSFIDSLGNFNREMYETALFDARNKEALVQAEEAVRQQLLSQKLQSILFATVNISEGEIKRKFIEQNIRMTAEFVLIDLNTIPDEEIKYDDNDLRNYYNQNPEQFSLKDQRKVKYVTFKIAPSNRDSNLVLQNIQNVYDRAVNDTADFKTYVDIYSEAPYSKDTLTINQLPADVSKIIENSNQGTIIGPVKVGNGYGIFKYFGSVQSTESFVRASHILIPSTGDDVKDLAEANRIHGELIKGANFAEYAKKYSQDPGSAKNGGDLGWFGKGQMVKEFEDASFNGAVNVIQKPVKSSYGYHIIKVTGKSNKKYIVEKISNEIKPSAMTRDEIYNKANDFAYLSDKNGFDKEAETLQYQVQESTPFNEDATAVPGIGYNKSIIRYAFENGLNTVSPVFKIPSGYVVFMISEATKAGVKKFDDVKEEIKTLVIKEKKYEKAKSMALDLKGKIGSDFSKALTYYSKARVDTTGEFTTSGSIPKVGMEYNFSASAYSLPLNQVSEPIKGFRGYFLVKVIKKNEFDNRLYEAQRTMLRDNLLQEKKSTFLNQWLVKIKEDADIVDKRYMFFGR